MPGGARSRKRDPRADLTGGYHYVDSTRHHLEVEHWSYRKTLERLAAELKRGATASPRQASPASATVTSTMSQ